MATSKLNMMRSVKPLESGLYLYFSNAMMTELNCLMVWKNFINSAAVVYRLASQSIALLHLAISEMYRSGSTAWLTNRSISASPLIVLNRDRNSGVDMMMLMSRTPSANALNRSI